MSGWSPSGAGEPPPYFNNMDYGAGAYVPYSDNSGLNSSNAYGYYNDPAVPPQAQNNYHQPHNETMNFPPQPSGSRYYEDNSERGQPSNGSTKKKTRQQWNNSGRKFNNGAKGGNNWNKKGNSDQPDVEQNYEDSNRFNSNNSNSNTNGVSKSGSRNKPLNPNNRQNNYYYPNQGGSGAAAGKYRGNNGYNHYDNRGRSANYNAGGYNNRGPNNRYYDSYSAPPSTTAVATGSFYYDNDRGQNRMSSNRSNRSNNYYYNNYDYSGEFRDNFSHSSNNQQRNNWRRFDEGKCNNRNSDQQKLDAASQRERLEQMLARRTLECLVCCEKIKNTDKVWSCHQCYHILHLNCVTAWANSSKLEAGWRCPACQNVCAEVPRTYVCYCGATTDPRPLPGVVPHACGEPCMRKGRTCDHRCTVLCHPGPCPECNAMVARPCGCGATTQTVKCSSDTEIVCNAPCKKLLNCGLHRCEARCHVGACAPCVESLKQVCYCGKVGRRVRCSEEFHGDTYACGETCEKVLTCGNHKCSQPCHEGPCAPCTRDVHTVTTCPCGRTELAAVRKSCLDPIPCCGKACGKILSCGQPAAPHACQAKCHEGPCPDCPLTTLVRCRCGHLGREMPCARLTTKADDARCERKCTKKRLCGRHRCNQPCCIEAEHVCPLPCNHLLACGQHRCDRTCHSGRCPPCTDTSFTELYCECGASVLYPPIPCGTRPPPCDKPCSRQRSCGHEVNHMCHTGACPPCTVLCKRFCHGKHEQRAAIPCHQGDFSCGLPCGKPMPCENHTCEKACHPDSCPLPCKQRCNVKRPGCGHPCGVACHKPPCPVTPCKQNVRVTCQCGLQKATRSCIELNDVYKEMEMASLKDKMADMMMKEQTVDISDLVQARKKAPSVLKILDCTEDCRVLERNRRLAIGLQIRNPDLSQKLTPRYSDLMRNWAKRDPQFCQKVHDKLTELVQLAKQSKQKSRSHSFESMNRDKRQFIHEYCEHFGCESAAYDAEPNRNIVATATKDKSWLPSMSLLDVIQRENGQRKVPGPVMGGGSIGGGSNKSEVVSLKLPNRGQKSAPAETIDYFDNPPC